MLRLALLSLLFATPAAAWQEVADLHAFLVGKRIDYPGVSQAFEASGVTHYGRTTGAWEVRDGRYCSVWPPATEWVCYGVDVSGEVIRFTAEDGTTTEGRLNR